MSPAIVCALVMISPVSFGMSAASEVCTAQQAEEAEAATSVVSSWDRAYDAFVRWNHCDDGGVAEAFSESLTLMLADQWQELSGMAAELSGSAPFRSFVIRHVDGTAPVERLERIAENASSRCPDGMDSLCAEIERAARAAMREAAERP